MTKHTPATPLPWSSFATDVHGPVPTERTHTRKTVANCGHAHKDAAYIAHAANAYPRLVEFAQGVAAMNPHPSSDRGNDARALLREIGE